MAARKRSTKSKARGAAQKKIKSDKFVKDVGAALKDAARAARKTARMYGTPIYVWENGKVVAKKP
jgi:hypothetical protein